MIGWQDNLKHETVVKILPCDLLSNHEPSFL